MCSGGFNRKGEHSGGRSEGRSEGRSGDERCRSFEIVKDDEDDFFLRSKFAGERPFFDARQIV